MLTDIEEIRRTDQIELTPKEEKALRYFVTAEESPVSPEKAAEMFELFLRGRDTDGIRSANPLFSLGSIVYARLLYRWDVGRKEVADRLRQGVIDRVVHARLEAASFSLDLISAAQKLYASQLQRYLQSGDPADFPLEIKPRSLRDFKAVAEIAKTTLQPMKPGAPRPLAEEEEDDNEPAPEPSPGEEPVAPVAEASGVLRLLAAASMAEKKGG